MASPSGKYVTSTAGGESVNAFVPDALPPAMAVEGELADLLGRAERELERLKVAAELVPNEDIFGYGFVRNEAVLSSQIEGVQATLSDLMNFEASPEDFGESLDIQEVCNYLEALNYGRKQLHSDKGLPLSLRLIREMHKRLMKGVRGQTKNPGRFRKSQNWIGGTRPGNAKFVPPPPEEMNECLAEFETFLHAPDPGLPGLIRIGMAHVQFETIHPFLDGNGRIGRLLIALLLESWVGLDARLLYLSLFFKRNHQEYYERLDTVRASGDWDAWTRFFLQGVAEVAGEAVTTAQRLSQVIKDHRDKLLKDPKMVLPVIRLFELLPSHPVITVAGAVKLLKTTKPTAGKAVETLVKAKILKETTGAKRNRMYGYQDYLDTLSGGASAEAKQ